MLVSIFMQFLLTGISANADGPCDAATHEIDHIVLDAKCNHREASVASDLNTLLHRPILTYPTCIVVSNFSEIFGIRKLRVMGISCDVVCVVLYI